MAKKVFYWICGLAMVLSLALGFLGGSLNPQQPGQPLTQWTLFTIFAVRPLFYLALGAVSAVKLFPKGERPLWRWISLGTGILLTVLLVIVSAAELLSHPVQLFFLQLLRQMFRVPGYFLIPGMLLGFGLFKD